MNLVYYILFWSLIPTVNSLPDNLFITHQHQSQHAIRFTIQNAGIDVNGTIDMAYCRVKLVPDDLASSLIEAACDPSSINTGIIIRDKHLKQQDYFNIQHYSLITIRSKTIERKGKNKFLGDFELKIKDIKRPVTILFTREGRDKKSIYRGNFSINRLDFGLGEKSIILDERVKVFVEIETSDE